MTLSSLLIKLDRCSFAFRLIGAAYLVLFTSWFLSDAELISAQSTTGIFSDLAMPLSPALQKLFLILGICSSISLIAVRLIKPSLVVSMISLISLLGQLPTELIQSTDRFLFALSLLLIIAPSQQKHQKSIATKLALSALVALWAWPNLYVVYQEASPLWTGDHFFNYWAWTDAAPTPLAIHLAQSPLWLKTLVNKLLLLAFAYTPVVMLLKIRIWPLVWLVFFAFFGFLTNLPSWFILALALGLLIACDQRWSNGLDQKLAQYIPLEKLSNLALLFWPLMLLGFWMSMSNHLGITPFLIIALYLLWSNQHIDGILHEPASQNKPTVMSILLKQGIPLALALLFLSLNLMGFEKTVRKSMPQASAWLWSQADARWTVSPLARASLVIERSEDGGASWQQEDYPVLSRVTMNSLPWRPFHPLREEKWYNELAHSTECEEGPFMELLERGLRQHVKRLNTPPLQTPNQLILIRARRIHWVRSRYNFWREEHKGFFCIATNLPVLLKARAMVKQAQEELPKMPRLDPSHKK